MKLLEFVKENVITEYKSAKGGLPNSLWETYSAFANSRGGTIYLGVSELKDGQLTSAMLSEESADKLIKEFFSSVNNPNKVSVNLLRDDYVEKCMYEGYFVVKISVPVCPKELKPVYINNNMNMGTYRRNNEGDYRCSISEIRSMLRDGQERSSDLACLEDLDLDTLCDESIQSYKDWLRNVSPDHVFLRGSDESFLEYIGAIRKGKDKQFHPTKAGLLMFGYAHKIVYEFPEYYCDYQQIDDSNPKWVDRVSSDSGTYSGNLYDFYCKISNKLTSDLKRPYRLDGIVRVDDTDMHKALREALCNCISNSDFYHPRGIVIKKKNDEIVFSNPGCLMMSVEDAFRGGLSDARNKTILKMFNLVGVGERAGSGIPLIIDSCKNNGLPEPILYDEYKPDRTTLIIKLNKNELEKVKVKREEKTVDEKEKKILMYLNNYPNSKAKDIADEFGYSLSTVKKKLYTLLEEEKVTSIGTIKDKKYSIR